jgi:hypothetical protein
MTDATNYYAPQFKAWGKQLGPKPTADQLASIHGLGCRPGKQALAIAMSLRDCGVTAGQIVMACGAPQLNKMRGLITDALLKREPVANTEAGHTVYKCVVTPKGLQRIKRTEAAAAKAEAAGAAVADDVTSKPKGKAKGNGKVAKARKAKVTSEAPKPASDVTAPMPATSPVDADNGGLTAP